VRLDVRGSGESDGLLADEYSPIEQADAVAVIAWLAAQPWCNGSVGMMGISWGGFNALQVAALRPPALKAIVTLCSTDDRYRDDVHWMGGARLNAGFGWAGFFLADMCHPPDPALVGEAWRAMWLDRLRNLPLFQERWLRHQKRDAYWKQGSVCEDYSAIQCPVFAVGGWTDGYTNAIPRLLEHLSAPRKGLIGPWAHAYPHFAKPGPQIGFLQEIERWWAHWLKGEANGPDGVNTTDEPMLRAWMTDSHQPAPHHEILPGRWVTEPAWPPPGNTPQRFPLAPGVVSTPQKLGAASGEWCPFGRGGDQAGDQRPDDALSLCFDMPALAEPLEILGAPVVKLDVTCDKPVANLIARLCDLRPSGESLRVSFGVLNLAHRDSHETPKPLVPGERYRVRLKLNDCGTRFPAGHRIRLALSTTYWPMVWPAPEAAVVTILGGSLELPVRPPRAERLRTLDPPDSAPADNPTPVRPGIVRYDKLDGLEVGTEGSWKFDIAEGDPLSAVADMRRTITVERRDWQVRAETTMRMTCTREAFHLTASLRAFEGEDEVCARDWDSTIPRDLV
jgi:predicted acyl esterase